MITSWKTRCGISTIGLCQHFLYDLLELSGLVELTWYNRDSILLVTSVRQLDLLSWPSKLETRAATSKCDPLGIGSTMLLCQRQLHSTINIISVSYVH